MFCNHCRIEFEPWKDRENTKHNIRCEPCYDKQWEPDRTPMFGKDRFCVVCGVLLPKVIKKTKTGKIVAQAGHFLYCSEHKPAPYIKKQRVCLICNKPLPKKAHKYHPECRPYPKHHNPNLQAHSLASLRWQKNNKEKAKAAQLARYHSYRLNILYECSCKTNHKHNHHFDYDRPYEVIRLCTKCHHREHRRLKNYTFQISQSSVREITSSHMNL